MIAASACKIEVSGKCGTQIDIRDNDTGKISEQHKCELWQTASEKPFVCLDEEGTPSNYYICLCDSSCTGSTASSGGFDHYYYDDPVNKNKQATRLTDGTDANVTLPVVLAWDQKNGTDNASSGWLYVESHAGVCSNNNGVPVSEDNFNFYKHVDPFFQCKMYYKRSDGFTSVTDQGSMKMQDLFNTYDDPDIGNSFGGNNYIFEIKNAKDLNLTDEQKKQHINKEGEYTLCLKSGQNEFNSVADGGACFFNSSTAYQWRVLTSCQKCDDSKPIEDFPGSSDDWWKFTTATAPELLGIIDKTRSVPEPDPDWNGPKALGEDDSNKKVDFCTAGLKWCAAKVASDKVVLNSGVQNSLEYQLMLNYNEAFRLKGILGGYYAQVEQSPLGGILKAAEGAIGTALENPSQKSCHYLLLQDDGKCQAEWIQTNQPKVPVTEFSNSINPNNNRDFFTKDLTYYWKLKSCFDNTNASVDENCHQSTDKNYGQEWKFMTNDANLEAPKLDAPPNDAKYNDESASTPVGIPMTISWEPPCGANSYQYELQNAQGQSALIGDAMPTTVARQVTFQKTTATSASAAAIRQTGDATQADLELNKTYRWHVRPCWPSLDISDHSQDKQLCEGNKWSDWSYFRTTGRPPQGLKTDDNKPAYIPTTFSWDPVPGAKSYILDISPNQGTHITKLVAAQDPTSLVTIQVSYPDLKPKLAYTWKVKTCADAAGTVDLCGDWSISYSFGTSTLPSPAGYSSPLYLSNVDSYPARLSWNAVKGAAAYRVAMGYINEDANSDCPKTGQLFDSVTPTNYFDPPGMALACLGTYNWSVTACFSTDCLPSETGSAATWKFFITKGEGKSSGFMVCGLRDDDPSTSWDERKACDLSDLLKLAWKLINFALFKLSFWLLPILAAITGGLFYTQFGGQDLLKKVKTMWKWIGIGYALLFFAWLITTWALSAFGFHGLWWKVL